MAEEKAIAKAGAAGSQMAQVNTTSMLGLDLSQIKGLAQAMAASGMFQDIQKDAAKAFVKILAGQEMGIPPFQAMSDIHIIQGKASAGGNIYASKIKMHPKYDYRVKNWTAKGCSIEFFERISGKLVPIGVSQFDENDAKQAGLLGKGSWSTYPRNMYFNRAITNGMRTYCPDALGGVPAYTDEELNGGKVNDADTGEVVHEVITGEDAEDDTDNTLDNPKTPEDDDTPEMPDDFLKTDDDDQPSLLPEDEKDKK